MQDVRQRRCLRARHSSLERSRGSQATRTDELRDEAERLVVPAPTDLAREHAQPLRSSPKELGVGSALAAFGDGQGGGAPRPRIAPTKRASSAAHGTEEQDPTRWRKQRFEAQGRARDRGTMTNVLEIMPPPRDLPTRRVTTHEEARLPHTDGEVLRVTGRSRFEDQMPVPP